MRLWNELAKHQRTCEGRHILDLFADSGRAEEFTVAAGEMRLDYSKTAIDAQARDLLVALAEEAGLAAARYAMF